jgi:hypothetical protein
MISSVAPIVMVFWQLFGILFVYCFICLSGFLLVSGLGFV